MAEIVLDKLSKRYANGFEAVRAVTQHDPDVLFLDIQMPKLDGFEVLELWDSDVWTRGAYAVSRLRQAVHLAKAR